MEILVESLNCEPTVRESVSQPQSYQQQRSSRDLQLVTRGLIRPTNRIFQEGGFDSLNHNSCS